MKRLPDSGNNFSHRAMSQRRAWILIAVTLALTASFLIDIGTGPAGLSIREVLTILLQSGTSDGAEHTIVWQFRLPTALMALLIGGSLGVAGAEMQTILNNPLASPFTLGVSAAASFGAASAFVFGIGVGSYSAALMIPVCAFSSALVCSLAIYGIGRLRGGATDTLIVGGVALHFLFSSGVAFLQYTAADDTLQAIVFWTFGTLQSATWQKLMIVGVVLLLTLMMLSRRVWQLTALRLGEQSAHALGIDVARLRLETLVLVSVLTATAVCFTGVIGFVGLVSPHIARMGVGEDQRFFLPLAALWGALLVSVAAVIGKTISPGIVFPIGIITAGVGAPFFAALVVLRRRSFW